MMYLMGIDIGTTGCKVVLYDNAGNSCAQGYREYKCSVAPDRIELDPELVFNSVLDCMSGMKQQHMLQNVRAISVSSMTDTVTAIGSDGRALLPSIIPFDPRGIEEADELNARFGAEWIYDQTGMEAHSSHTVCKLMWLKKRHPELTERTWKFMCYEDYILYRLGAEPVSSYTTASKTAYFDIHRLCWHETMLEMCGIRADQLPRPVPSGVPVGTVSAAIADATGLPATAVLVSGGFDQACCGLSCGIIHPGDVLDTTGTNGILFFALEAQQSRELLACNMNYSQHVVPEVFSSYALIFNAGGAFRWCRDALFPDFVAQNRPNIYGDITGGMKSAPENLLFLPFLSGMGTPEMDSNGRGAFFGLSLSADRYGMAQAILEGITYEMRYNIDLVKPLVHRKADNLIAVGGAAKSDFWMQLKCDIYNAAISVPQDLEPGACGAAMLAGIGCGMYANAEEAVQAFSRNRAYRHYEPDANRVRLYEDAYQRYLSVRNAYIGKREVFFSAL